MPGTKAGGLKAAVTNKQRHGDTFYAEIGRKGGSVSSGGGFAANPELAREAGRKGGLKSRRRPATPAAQDIFGDDKPTLISRFKRRIFKLGVKSV